MTVLPVRLLTVKSIKRVCEEAPDVYPGLQEKWHADNFMPATSDSRCYPTMDQTISAIAAQVAHADCVNALANSVLRPGTVVIDLGAGDGAWTRAALAGVAGLVVHCFEPDPVKYQQLLINLAAQISAGRVIPHNAAAGWADDRGEKGWASLQQYANEAGLSRLPFVRLGDDVPITAATDGCSDLIRRGYIEFILATADAQDEISLASVLSPSRYEVFRHPSLGNQVLCVSDRFRSTIKNHPPQMPSVLERCQEFNITPKGVIHVGARAGGEARLDLAVGDAKSLRIEADPAKMIDQIIEEAGHNPAEYDLLDLNMQGAELTALKGAIGMLANVNAILTEVNFEQRFAGCAQIEQIDDFLEAQGFDRVATVTPNHSGRGEAFYLRRRPAPVSKQAVREFLYNARNTIVSGWLNIPAVSLREAWEGATGRAHRHLIENGVLELPLSSDDDGRVQALLKSSLKSASKDRRLQLFLALMLYQPVSEIAISLDGIPGWLRKSLPGLNTDPAALAA